MILQRHTVGTMARTDQASRNHRLRGPTIESDRRVRSKEELVELRHKLQLTQKEMAFMLGVPVSSLESWERGHRAFSSDLIDLNVLEQRRECVTYQNHNLVFGEYDIGSVRRAFGITCREFAHILKCKWRSLEAYEQGRRPAPVELIAGIEALVEDRVSQIDAYSNNPLRKR